MTGRIGAKRASAGAVRAYGRHIARHPRAFAKSLAVVDFLTEGPVELAFIGDAGHEEMAALQQAVADLYLPNRIIATGSAGAPTDLPLLRGKEPALGKPALYICRNFSCQQPVTEARLVAEALGSTRAASSPREEQLLGSSKVAGMATIQGTAAYAARMIRHDGTRMANGYVALGNTKLTNSRLGFGTYRVDTEAGHREALTKALLEGCNVIDTSTNYMDGESERLVGSVLQSLMMAGEVRRERDYCRIQDRICAGT